MNRNDLVAIVAKTANVDEAVATATVSAILEAVTLAVGRGDEVHIRNFGRLSVRRIPERPGTNPRTREPMTVPAFNRLVFSPFRELRDASQAA